MTKHYFLFFLTETPPLSATALINRVMPQSYFIFPPTIAFLAILLSEWHLKRKRTTFISVCDRTWFGWHADGCKCSCANWTEPDARHKTKAEAYHVWGIFFFLLLFFKLPSNTHMRTIQEGANVVHMVRLKKGTRATSIGAQAALKLARILKCVTRRKKKGKRLDFMPPNQNRHKIAPKSWHHIKHCSSLGSTREPDTQRHMLCRMQLWWLSVIYPCKMKPLANGGETPD